VFSSFVCDSAVTEVPYARYHDSTAIVADSRNAGCASAGLMRRNRGGHSFAKELHNELDGRLRIFFHDPVA
jgi:hypothetical protein